MSENLLDLIKADEAAIEKDLQEKSVNDYSNPRDEANKAIEDLLAGSEPVEEEVKEPVLNKSHELSLEDKARLQGWRPQNEYRGDKDLWVDAKEFLHRGSYLKRIQQLEQMVNETAKTAARAREDAYKQALSDIEGRKQIARNMKDTNNLEDLINKEYELKNDFRVTQPNIPVTSAPVPNLMESQEFQRFLAQNPWADSNSPQLDKKMLSLATAISEEFYRNNPQQSPHRDPLPELNYVHEQMRKEMPHKFAVREQPAGSLVSKVSGVKYTKGTVAKSATTGDVERICARLEPAQAMVVKHLHMRGGDWQSYVKEVNQQSKGK